MTVATPAPVRFSPGIEAMLEPVGAVRPADRNPNNGDVEAIAESIIINGFQVPVIARRDTGEIVAGNHRYYALLRLGATQVPVIWTDMDDAAAARFLVADNRLARLGRDDPSQLLEMLTELSASPLGLAGTGFDAGFIDYLTDITGGPLDLSGVDERDFEAEATMFAKQTGRVLSCPQCGHEFTAGKR
jgi:hypothetical protein